MTFVRLRPIAKDDDALLRRIYASTREEELSVVPWSEDQKAAFLTMQFEAQKAHYDRHYPDAERSVILADDKPAGRLYVDRQPKEIRIIDIALLPEHRGGGIGTRLLQQILTEASTRHLPVRIHVERNNRALSLYRRLGFTPIGENGVYWLMEWKPAVS
jgi:ribosomal protein S18 acetylase RimI-like enzyme